MKAKDIIYIFIVNSCVIAEFNVVTREDVIDNVIIGITDERTLTSCILRCRSDIRCKRVGVRKPPTLTSPHRCYLLTDDIMGTEVVQANTKMDTFDFFVIKEVEFTENLSKRAKEKRITFMPDELSSIMMGQTTLGEWSKSIWCRGGKRVNGFRLRVEENQQASDDTALNGIQISCDDGSTTSQIPGFWGDWGNWVYCDSGTYVTAFDVRSETAIGRDDTFDNGGASNVKMRCSNGKELDGGGLDFGNFEGYKSCPGDSYYCGLRAQIAPDGGYSYDDTALNRIHFQCCMEEC